MFRKLTLAVSFAAGYVLGAKAGEERYDELQDAARAVIGRPAGQDLVASASSAARSEGEFPSAPPVPVPVERDEVVVPPVPDLVADLLPVIPAVEDAPTAELSPITPAVDGAPVPEPVVPLEERSIDDMTDLELELLTAPTPPTDTPRP